MADQDGAVTTPAGGPHRRFVVMDLATACRHLASVTTLASGLGRPR